MQRNEKTQELLFDMSLKEERNDAFNTLFTETKEGQQYEELYRGDADKTKHDRIAILTAVETLFDLRDSNVSVNQLAVALRNLILSGQIQPKDKEVEEPLETPTIDTTPRDKNGKALTESQLRYQEYRVWSEQASSAEVNMRKQSDPGYASYVRKALQAEMSSTQVGDGVTPEGQVTVARNTNPAQSLLDFASKYAKEPVANLKPKGGFITLAGEQMPWSTYQGWLTAATAAGAIR